MGDSDDEDDDDIVFSPESGHAKVTAKTAKEDDFEGEFGYALLKALRGSTIGRRLKRNMFKFGCIQLACSFSLVIITIQACKSHNNIFVSVFLMLPFFLPLIFMCINTAKSFQDTEYFDSPKYGATLLVSWLSGCNHLRYKFFYWIVIISVISFFIGL
jgi:hypothetical protein